MGYAAIGASHDDESGDYGQPSVNGEGIGTVNRLTVPYERDAVSGEIGIRGKFNTGPVGHTVNVGVSALRTDSRQAFEYVTGGPIDISDPVAIPRPTGGVPVGDMSDPSITDRTRLQSVALSDQLSFLVRSEEHKSELQSLIRRSYDG